MGEAIGQILPMAVGVALSPVPIIAVVLMLGTPRARSNGPAFLLGWLGGLLVVGTIVLLLSSGAGASEEGEPATWVSIVKIVLGLLLVLVAVRLWRGRPAAGEQAELPKWMRAIDSFTSLKAAGAGFLLSAVNPKNLVLTLAAAAAIAATGVDTGQQAIALLVFALIGTVGPGLPVAVYFLMGDRALPDG
jgi:threonine/homoserine/homoserine lactone efflux protein